MSRILILRPPPGDNDSAVRAEKLGLEAVIAPIFAVRPLPWDAPPLGAVETVMLTSANAARHGGAALADFAGLPCYAVGETTAEAARTIGFTDIRVGPTDGVALVAMMVRDGVRSTLHACGREHIPLADPALSIVRRIVYASEPQPTLPPEAVAAIREGTLVLLHSPRAASHFAHLVDEARLDRATISLAAISEAAVVAAGPGWKDKAAAAAPRDEALLELAAKLCQIKRSGAGQGEVHGL